MNAVIGYQGIPGSFSEEALHRYFPNASETKNFRYFEEVFQRLHDCHIDYGILPIENSNTGMIFEVYDCLQSYNLYIVGETYLQVAHHLLGVPGSSLESIEEVYSHPQGFKQSRRFLRSYDTRWQLIPYHNTAISARYVSEQNDPAKAAIASLRCRDIYGLQVLNDNIHDEAQNFTRFIIIGRQLEYDNSADKLSLVYSLPHRVGSLYTSLGVFAERGINLLGLQSRPIQGRPWEWYFYIDLAGSLDDTHVREALDAMGTLTQDLQVLGCYGARPDRLPLES